jgi:hypothetical protein
MTTEKKLSHELHSAKIHATSVQAKGERETEVLRARLTAKDERLRELGERLAHAAHEAKTLKSSLHKLKQMQETNKNAVDQLKEKFGREVQEMEQAWQLKKRCGAFEKSKDKVKATIEERYEAEVAVMKNQPRARHQRVYYEALRSPDYEALRSPDYEALRSPDYEAPRSPDCEALRSPDYEVDDEGHRQQRRRVRRRQQQRRGRQHGDEHPPTSEPIGGTSACAYGQRKTEPQDRTARPEREAENESRGEAPRTEELRWDTDMNNACRGTMASGDAMRCQLEGRSVCNDDARRCKLESRGAAHSVQRGDATRRVLKGRKGAQCKGA